MSISIFEFIAIIEEHLDKHRQKLTDLLGAEPETKRILNFVNSACTLQILLPDTEKKESVLAGSIDARAIKQEDDKDAIKCKLTWTPAKRTEQRFVLIEEGKESLRKTAVTMAESLLEIIYAKDKVSQKSEHSDSPIVQNEQEGAAEPTSEEAVSTETIQAAIDEVRSETSNIPEETADEPQIAEKIFPKPPTDEKVVSDIPKIGVEEVLSQLGGKLENTSS